MKQYNVGMVSLGCPKNQVDAERMLALLQADGFTLCGDIDECDAVIVNTCGFIEDAKRESIDAIFEAASHKGGRLRVLAVTGCLAERYRDEMATEIPEADVILGMGSIGDIAAAIRSALDGERVVKFAPKGDMPLDGARILTTEPYTAYLKIAEGCDNNCAYCSIPMIRGHFRSRDIESIMAEVNELAAAGVTELNVVAQDTTRYGQDLYGRLMLPELLRRICRVDGIHWVRVLYCYPDRTTDELLDVIADEPKMVKYIDLPLQHISDRILKSMVRRGSAAQIRELLAKIRRRIPGVAIRTTFIAGLPGETEEDFAELCDFVRDEAFERMGCFAYSPEEGTPAYDMPDQVDEETKHRRADQIMEIQMGIAADIAHSYVGTVTEVLCEGWDDEAQCWVGRSPLDAPDIDTKTYFTSDSEHTPGEYVWVEITGSDGYDLTGEETEARA